MIGLAHRQLDRTRSKIEADDKAVVDVRLGLFRELLLDVLAGAGGIGDVEPAPLVEGRDDRAVDQPTPIFSPIARMRGALRGMFKEFF